MVNVNKRKIKNENFIFNEQKNENARLYLTRSFTNLFLTLTDSVDKVIICKTSGSCGIYGNKRRKVALEALEPIVFNLAKYFELYKIQKVDIIIKTDMPAYIMKLIHELEVLNIGVGTFVMAVRVPHNGVKARKIPRK